MSTNIKGNEQEKSTRKKNFPWLKISKSKGDNKPKGGGEKEKEREKEKEKKEKKEDTERLAISPNILAPIMKIKNFSKSGNGVKEERDRKEDTARLTVSPNIQAPIVSPQASPVVKTQPEIADEARQMKLKYQNVPKQLTAEQEDKEVFENVGQSRPVFSNHLLRPGKMRWKDEREKEDEKKKEEKEEKTERNNNNNLGQKNSAPTVTLGNEKESLKRKQKKKDDKKKLMSREEEVGGGGAGGEGQEKALLVKIDKLEKENEDLKKRLEEVQKILEKRKEKEKKSKEMSEDISRVAIRTLIIMKKNHILDTMLDMRSNKLLYNFFRECEKPSEQVANLVEEAVTKALKYMIVCNHQIDDIIDGEMRDFICNTSLAKKAILRAMFLNPTLVPDMWGGGPMLEKIRKEKMQEAGEQTEEEKEKERRDRDKKQLM